MQLSQSCGMHPINRIPQEGKIILADDDQLRPTRHEEGFHAMAEAFGVGRKNVVGWRNLALAALLWGAANQAWAVYEIKTEPLVETVGVFFDEQMRPVYSAVARGWDDNEQMRATVAFWWVAEARTRSRDNWQVELSRAKVANLTARPEQCAAQDCPAFAETNTMFVEMDQKLKCDPEKRTDSCELGLAARDIIASPQRRDEETDSTVVRVEWKENAVTKDGQAGPTQRMYMDLVVRGIAPRTTQQVMANGFKVYVVDIGAVGRMPIEQAAAQ